MKLDYDWKNADLPIGALDSGLGGLSVLREMRRLLPHENLIFAGDCGKAPWGDRTDAWITARTEKIVRFLASRKIKVLVVACNTATAAAVDTLRRELPFPIIGIEPAVKPAVALSRDGIVGVLATTRTIHSPRLQSLIRRFAGNDRVILMACPGLMDRVEAGDFHSEETRRLIESYVGPLLKQGIDTLVLGCTHYPFLADEIRRAAGEGVAIIDPSPAVARFLKKRLEENSLLSGRSAEGQVEFWCTGRADVHTSVLRRLWPGEVAMKPLDQAWPELLRD